MADIAVANEGSIALVWPLSTVGLQWIEQNVDGEALWFGGALAVEPRYLDDLVYGMECDGLEIAGS
jgi:hypothetical protein